MTSWRLPDPRPVVSRSLRELTDGQRWTVAIALVVTLLFVNFGLRRPPEVFEPLAAAVSAPSPAAAPSPPPPRTATAGPGASPGTPGAVGRPADRGEGARRPQLPLPEDPAPAPAPPSEDPDPSVVAVVRSGDGAVAGRDDAAIAAVFLDDLPGATVVDVDEAAATLCGATPSGLVVVASEGLPEALWGCVRGAGAVVVSHDDRGSSGRALSTALGAQAALVESARTLSSEGVVGLVVQAAHEAAAAAAQETLVAEGYDVEVAVVADDGQAPVGEMLAFAGSDVETVVLGVPVAVQDRWLSVARTLRMPFDHVVADVADSVVNEGYTAGLEGVRAVTATRVAWFARDHEETRAQQRCRARFEAAVGSEVASAGELARVYQWCQHTSLAATIVAAGGAATAATDGELDSPLTSALVPSTETGFGPGAVAVLDWDSACACWTESVPYTTRRGPS